MCVKKRGGKKEREIERKRGKKNKNVTMQKERSKIDWTVLEDVKRL
jgi:hypothetical protein